VPDVNLPTDAVAECDEVLAAQPDLVGEFVP